MVRVARVVRVQVYVRTWEPDANAPSSEHDNVEKVVLFGFSSAMEFSKDYAQKLKEEATQQHAAKCTAADAASLSAKKGSQLMYLAPEEMLGSKVQTPYADMWGVGTLIYRLFFRIPLVTGSTPKEAVCFPRFY